MSRRIEVELTSIREDGSWTWRAAGAREPKGVASAELRPEGAKVGDVLRAEADFDLEGVSIVSASAAQAKKRNEAPRIEVIGPPRRDDEPLVTSKLSPKGRSEGRDRRPRREGDGDRPPRRDGPGRDGPGRDGPRGPRTEGARGDRPPRTGDQRGDRPARPGGDRTERPARSGEPRGERRPPRTRVEEPPKPKAKRLRPLKKHRNALLDELAVEQRPVADQLIEGELAGVRTAIEKENAARKARGEGPIGPELMTLAEQLWPRVRTAVWRDRAVAALADVEELDLRDLRSVVVAADAAARDEDTRALATTLREALTRRVEAEHATWLADMAASLADGRTVRALRLSSRPPKAGAMFPPDLMASMAEKAGAALTADATVERWGTVLDAVAHSPVRQQVRPASRPETPSEELLAVINRYASRMPEIGALFGITAVVSGRGSRAERPARKPPRPPAPPSVPRPPAPPVEAPVPMQPSVTTPVDEPAAPPPAETSEQLEEIPGPAQDGVVVAEGSETAVVEEGEGAGVPAGEDEDAPDLEGAAPVVHGVADEDDIGGAEAE